MGAEVICRVRHRDQASQGLALLETGELLFRGDFRLKIPFRDIESIECKGPELCVAYGDEIAVFELGKAAEAWAAKIRNPRGRLEKLGVKPGQRLSVLGLQDDDFVAELRALSTNISIGSIAPGSDLVFYAAAEVDDLAHLPELRIART